MEAHYQHQWVSPYFSGHYRQRGSFLQQVLAELPCQLQEIFFGL